MDDYKRAGHVKYSLKAHIIFVTKYRKKIFWDNIQNDVKRYLHDAASQKSCKILEMETDIDHVHILLEYETTLSVSDIVKHLKRYSTYMIWKDHGDILKQLYWKRRNLWSDGYFVCSIGQVSQATIETYIRNQG